MLFISKSMSWMKKSEKHERYSVDGPNNGIRCALYQNEIASVNSRILLKDLYCNSVFFYYLHNNIFVSNALILWSFANHFLAKIVHIFKATYHCIHCFPLSYRRKKFSGGIKCYSISCLISTINSFISIRLTYMWTLLQNYTLFSFNLLYIGTWTQTFLWPNA
jgi:hypothetical protein